MKFLVDANVLSEPSKPSPNARVVAWLTQHIAAVGVTPVILGELRYGILKLPAGKRKSALLEWFAQSVQMLPVLPIDAGTAIEWSTLLAELRRKGRSMPITDSLIAASARQHGLAVVTRNTSDYQYSSVRLVNPFGE